MVGRDVRDQPQGLQPHPNSMSGRRVTYGLAGLCLALLLGCTNQNPDQIRQKTAEETAALKRDTKAVAQGLKDGLSSKRAVDLNKATKDDLTSLPGVTTQKADRIIAERPYANTHQLVTRRILSEDEYAQVQDRVVVGK